MNHADDGDTEESSQPMDGNNPEYQTENFDAWVLDGRLQIYLRKHPVVSFWAEMSREELGELADLRAQWWNDEHV